MKKIDEGTRIAWQLFEDDDCGLVLSVLCGDIGLYEVKIILRDEEIARYRAEGSTVLDDIAYKVSKSPKEFSEREVKI